MFFRTQKRLFLVLLAGLLVISACGPGNSKATPTEMGLDAVYTAAAGTVMAQLTDTAAKQPTATLVPSSTATGTVTATLAPIPTQTTAPAAPSGSTGAVGCNNSAYITDVTVPDNQQVAPGQAFTKTWRLQNTGSCAWTTSYKVSFLSGDAISGAATALTQTVNPGATADISVNMVAPSSPKTYVGYWKLVNDAGQAFGTSFYVQIVVAGASVTPGTVTGTVTGTVLPSATPTFGASGCYNSAVINETIPDGTKMDPGESFTKSWTAKNTGTCEWTADFKLVFLSNPMGSDTFKIRRNVAPNATTDFYVDMVAPSSPGTYTGIWRLSTDDSKMFGTSFSVVIVVPGATFTPTFTPSITLTPTPVPATSTPTGTPTPPPTDTQPAPNTETPTPTPTQ